MAPTKSLEEGGVVRTECRSAIGQGCGREPLHLWRGDLWVQFWKLKTSKTEPMVLEKELPGGQRGPGFMVASAWSCVFLLLSTPLREEIQHSLVRPGPREAQLLYKSLREWAGGR